MFSASTRWWRFLLVPAVLACGLEGQNALPVADQFATRPMVSAKAEALAPKLNELAARGYRIARVEAEVGLPEGVITVLMERAGDAPCEYAFVRGSIFRNKILLGLTDEGSKGFHVVPDSMVDFGRSKELSAPEYGAVMEKCSKDSGTSEYRIKNAMSIGNLQKDIEAGSAQGFRPVMTGFHFVVLEKRSGAAAVAAQAYKYFVIDHVKDAEKKVAGLTDGGYRIAEIHYVPASDYAFGIQESTIVMMLERSESPVKYKYVAVSEKLDKNDLQGSATRQLKSYEEALNQAGVDGYQVVAPIARIRWNNLFRKTVVTELSAVVEKTADRHYQYRFVIADDPQGLYKMLDEGTAQGFHLARRGLDDSSALLEREVTK